MRSAPWGLAALVAFGIGCSPPPPSTLDGRLSLPDPHHVLVQGETNLPEKAQILVSVLGTEDETVIVQSLPLVKDGRFQALVALPAGLARGDYRVRLTFSPAAFDWSRGKVTAIVGSRGEHLSGPLTKKTGGVTVLERDLPLRLP